MDPSSHGKPQRSTRLRALAGVTLERIHWGESSKFEDRAGRSVETRARILLERLNQSCSEYFILWELSIAQDDSGKRDAIHKGAPSARLFLREHLMIMTNGVMSLKNTTKTACAPELNTMASCWCREQCIPRKDLSLRRLPTTANIT